MALADPQVTPDQVIEACAKTIKAKNTQITLAQLALKQSNDVNLDQTKQIESLKAERDAWYRDWKTTTVIGFIIGAVVYGYVKK